MASSTAQFLGREVRSPDPTRLRPAARTPEQAEHLGPLDRPWSRVDVPLHDRPRLQMVNFSVAGPTAPGAARATPDKSTKGESPFQDAGMAVSSFAPHAAPGEGGVDIELTASTTARTAGHAGIGALIGAGIGGVALGVAALAGTVLTGGLLGAALLGGAAVGGLVGGVVGRYRFTQTIDTTAPMGGAASPYVDPRPNDDTKPFYWTDAEEASHDGTFRDAPRRPTPGAGTTDWDAVISLTDVVGSSVQMLDTMTYGFSIDPAGSVTTRAPKAAPAGVRSTHVATLAGEFADWTFSP